MDRDARRAILLALNACADLSRESICKLALTVEQWSVVGFEPSPEAAVAVEVSVRALATAIEVSGRAPAIARALLADAAARGLSVIVAGDDEYPHTLAELALPPPVLYCRGRLPPGPAIAIVGSRAADSYGLEATRHFAAPLARAGLVIVSGLARGIDTAAHRAALEAEGTTVAVLGCGLDIDYPRGSARLRRDIERHGAIVSEFAIGMPALPENFPIRNRIIAALGCACLVIQAAWKSGSLSTARQAGELGRDLWALPGRIFDRRSDGTNALIRDGASPALDPHHLLESLPLEVKKELDRRAAASADAVAADGGSPSTGGGSARAARGIAGALLDRLAIGDPTTAEDLARRSGQPVDRVLAALLDLEIEGRVSRVAGSRYVRRASGGRL